MVYGRIVERSEGARRKSVRSWDSVIAGRVVEGMAFVVC